MDKWTCFLLLLFVILSYKFDSLQTQFFNMKRDHDFATTRYDIEIAALRFAAQRFNGELYVSGCWYSVGNSECKILELMRLRIDELEHIIKNMTVVAK